jgi:Protein of unknown function (DUF3726)
MTTIVVSLNEVESTVRKAFRGAGYHWGEAEEAGKAAVWLVRRKLPVMQPLLRLLRSLDGPIASRRPVVGDTIWRAAGGRLCPVLTGIVLADSATDLRNGSEIRFENLLLPQLLTPFAALAAKQSQLNISVHWHGNRIVVQGGGYRGDLANAEDQATALLTAQSPSSTFETMATGEGKTLNIESEHWGELNRFAGETYVPASERSRTAGAGAGLTDND